MRPVHLGGDSHASLPRGVRARLGHLARCPLGSSTIETALGLSLLVTMMLGIMELSMVGYTYSVYADAARIGLRYAVTHGTDSTSCSGPSTGCGDTTAANVASAVTNYVSGLTTTASSVNVSVNYPDGSSAPSSRVTVTVSYQYKSMFSLPTPGATFTATSAGRILY